MSYKKATCVVNIILIVLGVSFIIAACNFQKSMVKLTIQPSYYPIGVASLLILFCLISTVQTLRKKEDKDIETGDLKKESYVLFLCIAFGVLWKLTGQFYVVSFVITALLMYGLNPQPNSGKKCLKVLVYTLALQVIIYLIFQNLMKFKL